MSDERYVITSDGIMLPLLYEIDTETETNVDSLFPGFSSTWTKEHGGSKLRLSTEWIDGRLYIAFYITDISGNLIEVRDSQRDAKYTILIQSDGDEVIARIPIMLSMMIASHENDGTVNGLSYYTAIDMRRRTYESVGGWTFLWNW